MFWQNLRAPWHDRIVSTDASLWGAGVVTGHRSSESVASAARFVERDRFTLAEERAVARVAAGLKEGSGPTLDSKHDRDNKGCMNTFAGCEVYDARDWHQVPDDMTHGPWNLVCSHPWSRAGANLPELEARAALIGVRHILRNKSVFGKRFLNAS